MITTIYTLLKGNWRWLLGLAGVSLSMIAAAWIMASGIRHYTRWYDSQVDQARLDGQVAVYALSLRQRSEAEAMARKTEQRYHGQVMRAIDQTNALRALYDTKARELEKERKLYATSLAGGTVAFDGDGLRILDQSLRAAVGGTGGAGDAAAPARSEVPGAANP